MQSFTLTLNAVNLDKINKFMDNAEYTKALKTIKNKLNLALNNKSKVQLYWLEGICFVTLGQEKKAQNSFFKLLSIHQEFTLPKMISPKILSIYQKAFRNFANLGGLDFNYNIKFDPIKNINEINNLKIPIEFSFAQGQMPISDVHLLFREVGDSNYLRTKAKKINNSKYVFTVAKNFLPVKDRPYAIEYYVEALSSSGYRLTGVSNNTNPLTFTINYNNKGTSSAKKSIDIEKTDKATKDIIGLSMLVGAVVYLSAIIIPNAL